MSITCWPGSVPPVGVTDTYVINNINKSAPDARIPALPHEVDLGDLRLILLPPGKSYFRQRLSENVFDVNLAQTIHNIAINSDKLAQSTTPAESLAFLPAGTEFFLEVDNQLPGCVLEVSDAALHRWMEDADIAVPNTLQFHDYVPDPVATTAGRAAIQHLMRAANSNSAVDRLTVEALSLSIAARGLARLVSPDGDIDAEICRWDARGHSGSISRAIDCLEARLGDTDLAIRDLARAAAMSPSHFSSIFKSAMGETPYAFILRRRAEFARDLIIGTRDPLAQIAYDAGFSSQAHMTVVTRQTFGTTPAVMRKG